MWLRRFRLAERRRGLGHQLVFPRQRMADDGVEVFELRRPVEPFADPLRGRDRHDDIAGPAAAELDRERMADTAGHGIEHFANRIAAAVAAIERLARAARAEIVQRRAMRARQIADMDEIADTRSIWRLVIGAEHVDAFSPAERGFHRHLDEM